MTEIPDKQAVAISYNPGEDPAPLLVAKGKGYLAERIIEIAKENGIYVHPDAALVELLMSVELSEAVPPQLYQVVASVLAMVYRTNKRLGREKGIID